MSEKFCILCFANYSPKKFKTYEDDFINDLISKIFFYFQIDLYSHECKEIFFCNICVETINKITEFHEKIKKAQGKIKALFDLKVEAIKEESFELELEIKESILNPLEEKKSYQNNKIKKTNFNNKVDPLWEGYQWKCLICTCISSSKKEYRKHFEENHKSSNIKYCCMDCEKNYENFKSFKLHVKSHKNKFDYSCKYCGKYFYLHRYLLIHEQSHLKENSFNCSLCDKTFHTKALLRIHRKIHLPDDLKYVHECTICHKKFSNSQNLKNHKKTIHTNLKQFICQECGKDFSQKVALDMHILNIHSDSRPFQCNLCPKKFKTNINLKKHEKTHTGERPHQCNTCGKSFSRKGTLKRHETIHSGLMPFQCSHCDKCFRIKENLRVHIRQHTGEKPYSCQTCDRYFTDSSNYIKHMRNKHGVKTIAKNLMYSRMYAIDKSEKETEIDYVEVKS